MLEIGHGLCTQTMLSLTCTIISSVDLAHHGVSRAKGWVSVDCDTSLYIACESIILTVGNLLNQLNI